MKNVRITDPYTALEIVLSTKEHLSTPLCNYGYSLDKDLGNKVLVVGNAAGMPWEENYRCFQLKKGTQDIATIGFAVDTECNNYLLVALQRDSVWHNSLQLNIDKYFEKIGNTLYEITHDGRLTVGRSGAAAREDVLGYLETLDAFLLDQNTRRRIELGRFTPSEKLSINDPNFSDLLLRTAIYSYDRDIFRKKHKEIKAKQKISQVSL